MKEQGVSTSAFGKVFIFAYAFGDRLVVHDSWVHDGALQ